MRNWSANHRDKVRVRVKNWYHNCGGKQTSALWRENNRDKWNAYSKKARSKQTPQQKLKAYIGSHMSHALRGEKGFRKWINLVSYSFEDLQKHLENQFADKMCWDNYGKWHVDHIIPATWFEYQSPEDREFKQCWALANLRPLWAEENVAKGARHSSTFI